MANRRTGVANRAEPHMRSGREGGNGCEPSTLTGSDRARMASPSDCSSRLPSLPLSVAHSLPCRPARDSKVVRMTGSAPGRLGGQASFAMRSPPSDGDNVRESTTVYKSAGRRSWQAGPVLAEEAGGVLDPALNAMLDSSRASSGSLNALRPPRTSEGPVEPVVAADGSTRTLSMATDSADGRCSAAAFVPTSASSPSELTQEDLSSLRQLGQHLLLARERGHQDGECESVSPSTVSPLSAHTTPTPPSQLGSGNRHLQPFRECRHQWEQRCAEEAAQTAVFPSERLSPNPRPTAAAERGPSTTNHLPVQQRTLSPQNSPDSRAASERAASSSSDDTYGFEQKPASAPPAPVRSGSARSPRAGHTAPPPTTAEPALVEGVTGPSQGSELYRTVRLALRGSSQTPEDPQSCTDDHERVPSLVGQLPGQATPPLETTPISEASATVGAERVSSPAPRVGTASNTEAAKTCGSARTAEGLASVPGQLQSAGDLVSRSQPPGSPVARVPLRQRRNQPGLKVVLVDDTPADAVFIKMPSSVLRNLETLQGGAQPPLPPLVPQPPPLPLSPLSRQFQERAAAAGRASGLAKGERPLSPIVYSLPPASVQRAGSAEKDETLPVAPPRLLSPTSPLVTFARRRLAAGEPVVDMSPCTTSGRRHSVTFHESPPASMEQHQGHSILQTSSRALASAHHMARRQRAASFQEASSESQGGSGGGSDALSGADECAGRANTDPLRSSISTGGISRDATASNSTGERQHANVSNASDSFLLAAASGDGNGASLYTLCIVSEDAFFSSKMLARVSGENLVGIPIAKPASTGNTLLERQARIKRGVTDADGNPTHLTHRFYEFDKALHTTFAEKRKLPDAFRALNSAWSDPALAHVGLIVGHTKMMFAPSFNMVDAFLAAHKRTMLAKDLERKQQDGEADAGGADDVCVEVIATICATEKLTRDRDRTGTEPLVVLDMLALDDNGALLPRDVEKVSVRGPRDVGSVLMGKTSEESIGEGMMCGLQTLAFKDVTTFTDHLNSILFRASFLHDPHTMSDSSSDAESNEHVDECSQGPPRADSGSATRHRHVQPEIVVFAEIGFRYRYHGNEDLESRPDGAEYWSVPDGFASADGATLALLWFGEDPLVYHRTEKRITERITNTFLSARLTPDPLDSTSSDGDGDLDHFQDMPTLHDAISAGPTEELITDMMSAVLNESGNTLQFLYLSDQDMTSQQWVASVGTYKEPAKKADPAP